jgi:hypothetical protein
MIEGKAKPVEVELARRLAQGSGGAVRYRRARPRFNQIARRQFSSSSNVPTRSAQAQQDFEGSCAAMVIKWITADSISKGDCQPAFLPLFLAGHWNIIA